MGMKSFADTCLARAAKTKTPHELIVRASPRRNGPSIDGVSTFYVHAPTDVVELATRLKRACDVLRRNSKSFEDHLEQIADELEREL